MKNETQILIYKAEDGHTKLDVRLEKDTVWLSQSQMMELFQQTKQNISLHINNIYKEEAENSRSRGDILGFALDAHQELKDSPQGKTFHSFWKFLVADSGKDSISSLVQNVYEILEEKSDRPLGNPVPGNGGCPPDRSLPPVLHQGTRGHQRPGTRQVERSHFFRTFPHGILRNPALGHPRGQVWQENNGRSGYFWSRSVPDPRWPGR